MASQGNDCFYFYNATCYKGDRCQFRHCDAALGSEMVCEDWMNGICFVDDCPYRHMEVQEPQQNNVPCYYDMQPGGCRRVNCQYVHGNQGVQGAPNKPVPSAGFTSLVEIPLVSDLPNENPMSDLPPHQMSMSYEEPYTIPAVIGSHRMSGEVELVSPQVEPIIINPFEDESSDPESSPSLSPVKSAGKPGLLEGIPEEGGDVRNVDKQDGKSDAKETDNAKADTSKSDAEEAVAEEEVEESEEEEESGSTECEDEPSEETECEDERPVIELFDTEGHEVLGDVEEKHSQSKGESSKNGKKEGTVEKKESKEDTDLSEVLSLEEVMRRKALESMYKRRAEKEKAKQEGEKKKEEPEKKKDIKDDRRDDKKKPRRSRSRSRSPYRRGRSPDIRGNWRGRRRPSPFGRGGRWSPPPFGRRSPPFGRRSPPRRRSPFRQNDRHDPAHRQAVQRLRGQRNQAERDLEELAIEANKLEQKIRSSAESVKILKQVELKKRKELLRKQLEQVSKELANEGDDSSSSSSSSSSSCSCTESDSTSESSSPKKKVSVIASKIHRHPAHKHKHEKNTGVRKPLTLEGTHRKRALKTQPLNSAQHLNADGSVTLEEIRRRRALKMKSLTSAHVDSDGSGKKVQGISLAEIRRRRALKFGMVKPASGSEEDIRRTRLAKVAKSSSDEQSSGDGEGSQDSGPKELVILKKVKPLRKMNIRKVVSQGAKNSEESLELQAQRELKNKNALRNIQVQRVLRNESADVEPEPPEEEMLELKQERRRLLHKLKDGEVEEETGEVAEKKPSSDGEAKMKPKTSFRRVLVVGNEEPKKDTSVTRAATDIVIKSLEDIKKEKERQRDTLRAPEEADSADNSLRRRLNTPHNKSDTNLLKRGAIINDEDSEAKRRFIRRNPQQIYVPPAAAKFRETVRVDELTSTAASLPEPKFVEKSAPKVEATKIPISQLKEPKSSGGEIVVKTFSEIMKEKRERKQKELEEKRAAASSKTFQALSKPKPAFISPITFASDKDKPKVSLSETTLPKRKLYPELEKQESRMLANWGARRTKINKVQPNYSKSSSTSIRTNAPTQKSKSESSVSIQKMEIIDLPPDDDDLDLDEFEMELRDEIKFERSKPEPVVTKPAPVITKLVPVATKPKGSGDAMKAAPVVNSVKAMPKSVEHATGKRKTSSEEKSKPSHRTSTSDNLLDDEFDLLLEEDDNDLDEDALLMKIEEMLA